MKTPSARHALDKPQWLYLMYRLQILCLQVLVPQRVWVWYMYRKPPVHTSGQYMSLKILMVCENLKPIFRGLGRWLSRWSAYFINEDLSLNPWHPSKNLVWQYRSVTLPLVRGTDRCWRLTSQPASLGISVRSRFSERHCLEKMSTSVSHMCMHMHTYLQT